MPPLNQLISILYAIESLIDTIPEALSFMRSSPNFGVNRNSIQLEIILYIIVVHELLSMKSGRQSSEGYAYDSR